MRAYPHTIDWGSILLLHVCHADVSMMIWAHDIFAACLNQSFAIGYAQCRASWLVSHPPGVLQCSFTTGLPAPAALLMMLRHACACADDEALYRCHAAHAARQGQLRQRLPSKLAQPGRRCQGCFPVKLACQGPGAAPVMSMDMLALCTFSDCMFSAAESTCTASISALRKLATYGVHATFIIRHNEQHAAAAAAQPVSPFWMCCWATCRMRQLDDQHAHCLHHQRAGMHVPRWLSGSKRSMMHRKKPLSCRKPRWQSPSATPTSSAPSTLQCAIARTSS